MKNLKTIITVFALLIITVSCNQSETGVVVSEEEKAKFQKQIETFKTFAEGFKNKDIDLLMSVMADTVKWSPPQYNGNQTLDIKELKAAGESYMDSFDNITFNEGDGLVGSDNAFWSGSLYSATETNTDPSVMRVYGTWSMTHTESGAPVSNKWYGVLTFNDDGKIAVFSDWMDVNGMQVQIQNYLDSNK